MHRILLVKLSSLGDVIHNLPVVSDIRRHRPDVEIDWVTESPYVPLVQLHSALHKAYPLSLRHLKKNWWSLTAWKNIWAQRNTIKQLRCDLVLDTQGLLKSALVAGWNAAPIAGFGALSAREAAAARHYSTTAEVPRDQHAVTRNRALAAAILGYTIDPQLVDYGLMTVPPPLPGIPADPSLPGISAGPYVVLLHATSRANKMWPTVSWIALGQRLLEHGFTPILPWGSNTEYQMSTHIAEALNGRAWVPPALGLPDAAALLAHAQCVVGVDTGLAHLAVALRRPVAGIYLTTSPALTGLYAGSTAHDTVVNLGGGSVQAPATVPLESVWQTISPWLLLSEASQ